MTKKVLLVDDLVLDIVLTRRALKDCEVPHDIIVAGDGAEALSLVNRTRFDLVLLDIKMPRVDGFEMLQELRRSSAQSDLPVIILSGSRLEADQRRARTLGVLEYVHKALDYSVFQQGLKAALSRHGFC